MYIASLVMTLCLWNLITLKPDPFINELVVSKWFRNNPSIILFVQFVGI